MDVGIGLPNTIAGVDGRTMTAWARRAEERGFSTLGTIGRIVYHTYEELVTMSAAAAVTERIRLTTAVLLAPLYANTALLAKQAATLDALSGGRLVLGLGLGAREDDYTASGVPMRGRGPTLDGQLERLRGIWSGEEGIGPAPARAGGPPVLIGGGSEAVARRVARFGDGFISGGGGPAMLEAMVEPVRKAWSDAGRPGTPRFAALAYFALGPAARDDARGALGDYYAFLPDFVEMIIQGAATDAATVKGYTEAFASAGCDELIFMPCSSDLAEVDRLADAVR